MPRSFELFSRNASPQPDLALHADAVSSVNGSVFPVEKPYKGERLLRLARRLKEDCEIQERRNQELVHRGQISLEQAIQGIDRLICDWIIDQCLHSGRLSSLYMERPTSPSHRRGAITFLAQNEMGVHFTEPSPYQDFRYAKSDFRYEKRQRLYLSEQAGSSVFFDWQEIPQSELKNWLVSRRDAVLEPAVGLYPVEIGARTRHAGKRILTMDPQEIVRCLTAQVTRSSA